MLGMAEQQERSSLGSDTMEHHTRRSGLPVFGLLSQENSSSSLSHCYVAYTYDLNHRKGTIFLFLFFICFSSFPYTY